MLSEKDIQHYQRDGYIIPDWQLDQATLQGLKDALESVLAANPDRRPEQLISAHIPEGKEGVDGHQAFLDIAFHPDIVKMVQAVAGEDLILWGCHIFCKPAGDGQEVPFHQDGEYWPIDPLATTSVWLALDDSVVENGCLRVVAGSHKDKTLFPHAQKDEADKALDAEIDPNYLDEQALVDVELKAGGLSIHDIHLIHGSAKNVSDRRRAGVALRFMPATSHFDRSLRAKRTTAAGLTVDFSNRPLWLVSGQDQHGQNGPFEHNPN